MLEPAILEPVGCQPLDPVFPGLHALDPQEPAIYEPAIQVANQLAAYEPANHEPIPR